MRLSFKTVDVFTGTRFQGNPLAVVLDADALSTVQMQAIAREFNYSETAFVCAPRDPLNTAEVRIFTPTVEVPFAGHPNIGTAFVLSSMAQYSNAGVLRFEERAGLVAVHIARSQGGIIRTELIAPQALSVATTFPPEAIADCLGLDWTDISVKHHAPIIASVGLPFLIAEIVSRKALARASPRAAEFAKYLPRNGADAIYIYTHDVAAGDGEHIDLSARMFAPWDGLPEDPATGSATGAAVALAYRTGAALPRVGPVRVAQGVDMGRPCLLEASIITQADQTLIARVGGTCVDVMEGTIQL
ncbi:PhzF family phenazine biosynthesis protein [Bradyrhizobium sp. 61]|uniref:PhzF family phenazine biosynthesis protein n=1 Tax=unclassified Bradyrhizobium TaxID=2631580 RepID=UPI001FFC19AD|nr:PhzF family phenazine biosynthesis protein [Bradyrhizobium sp. 61]MCK1441698.1 PhzF family phenazine biosynthesis protein [Bradyrhizobium sp. 48]MCK1465240.1 PhzF family phenazine biosynthesis protein [Bradyrhizobium sp. 2]